MPEDFLTLEELEEFIKKLDSTLSYIGSNEGFKEEDYAYYTNMYFSLIRFKGVIDDK